MRDARLVEIQLRTPLQHEWAIAVERATLQLRMPLKFGQGEPVVLEYFAMAARGIELSERAITPDEVHDDIRRTPRTGTTFLRPTKQLI
jgi:hypothetical protein